MKRDLPIVAEVERIERALVKALKLRIGNGHVYCDGGTWFAARSDEEGWSRETVNITELARDMERELSC